METPSSTIPSSPTPVAELVVAVAAPLPDPSADSNPVVPTKDDLLAESSADSDTTSVDATPKSVATVVTETVVAKKTRVLPQNKLDKVTGFNTHKSVFDPVRLPRIVGTMMLTLSSGYRRVYIGNLPDTATLADLEDCFGQIGECTCAMKRGFGFVVSGTIPSLLHLHLHL